MIIGFSNHDCFQSGSREYVYVLQANVFIEVAPYAAMTLLNVMTQQSIFKRSRTWILNLVFIDPLEFMMTFRGGSQDFPVM